ncbi:MAG: prepilin-type N-terminal cleavage/methylation domain-containing protein [Deltaproteobacteria bacterium]|nr:prepilin-type N-terminal cleavage/methylation domain-containing protein [Deltaproteobacteria bacterium]
MRDATHGERFRRSVCGCRSSSAGMTLLEVLIGIVILMIITATLGQASWLTTRGKRRIDTRQLVYHQGRVAMEMIVKDLTLAFIVKPTLNPLGRDLSTFKTGLFGTDEGDADAIHCTTLSGRRYIAGEPAADQREVSYTLEELDPDARFTRHPLPDGARQLVRREDRSLDDDVKAGGEGVVIAEGILKFDLTYWDPKTGEWSKEWDSTTRAHLNTLPRAIQVTMAFANPLDVSGEAITFQSMALLGLGPDPLGL